MLSGFIHVVTNGRLSLFLLGNILLYVYTTFLHPFIHVWTLRSIDLSIVNNVSINTGVYISFWDLISFPHTHPGVGLLEHLVVLFLDFWRIYILVYIVAISIDIPNNSVQRVPFFHIFTNTCYLSFWWWPFYQVWGDNSLLFWLAFPQWLVTFSIFSCSYWQFWCLLWKMYIQVPSPFLNHVSWYFILFCWCVVWVSCILNINPLILCKFPNIFSHCVDCFFVLFDCFFYCEDAF